jgi:hypothetical protein
MISPDEYARFEQLRADLFDAIAEVLSEGGGGKSYEGTFRIQFPGYGESRAASDLTNPTPWGIFLDCYLIGPNRHYEWWGETFAAVLLTAETDIRAWMHEEREEGE